MSTDNPGTYGRYNGPVGGSSPANDSDLHTSANPYASGSPAVNGTDSSTYAPGRQGSADNLTAKDVASQTPYDVAAPYFANPPASGGNPHSQSAPSKGEQGDRGAAGDIASGLDALYQHTLSNYTGAGMGGSPADVYADEGYGPSGTGRS